MPQDQYLEEIKKLASAPPGAKALSSPPRSFPIEVRPDDRSLRELAGTGGHQFRGSFRDDTPDEARSIVHGDLNAKNVVWAAAIQQLVLIDFEHTGVSVWGVDQCRLMTNLLVELPQAVQDVKHFSDKLEKSISSAFEWYGTFWDLCGDSDLTGENSLLGHCVSTIERSSENDGLSMALAATARSLAGSGPYEAADWRKTLRTFLAQSSLKEFEYGMRNVWSAGISEQQSLQLDQLIRRYHWSNEGVDISSVVSGLASEKGPLAEVFAADERGLTERAAVLRYFLAYRLLQVAGLDG